MMISKDDPNHSYNLIENVLKNNPFIWFDNNSMAFTIHKDRKSVSRSMQTLKKNNLVEYKGRYFTYKVIKVA